MLKAQDSLLVVVDVQGKLAEIMHNRDEMLGNIGRLAESSKLLGVPVLVTEQLPDKLGPTRDELSGSLSGTPVITKSSFSCCGEDNFMQEIQARGKKQIVLCGIEAHVCVTQTALQLLEQDFEVFLVADAVSSRTAENKQVAIDRLRSRGAEIIVTEMALFEWLRDATHPAFRDVRKHLA